MDMRKTLTSCVDVDLLSWQQLMAAVLDSTRQHWMVHKNVWWLTGVDGIVRQFMVHGSS